MHIYVYEPTQLCENPMIQQYHNTQKEWLKTEETKIEKESVSSMSSDYNVSDVVVLTYFGLMLSSHKVRLISQYLCPTRV